MIQIDKEWVEALLNTAVLGAISWFFKDFSDLKKRLTMLEHEITHIKLTLDNIRDNQKNPPAL